MSLTKKCPVCKGTALRTYRLYHDCSLRGGAPALPSTKKKAGINMPRSRRPGSRSPCPVCKKPGTERLVFCAGCRTFYIGQPYIVSGSSQQTTQHIKAAGVSTKKAARRRA